MERDSREKTRLLQIGVLQAVFFSASRFWVFAEPVVCTGTASYETLIMVKAISTLYSKLKQCLAKGP